MSKNNPFGPSPSSPNPSSAAPGSAATSKPCITPRESFAACYRRRVIHHTSGPSLTKQEFRQDSDINRIMSRYQKTGAINHYATYSPQYGDYTSCDFQQAQNLVNSARKMFADLPSSIRQLTQTPEGFLDFVQDPANAGKLVELGLVPADAPPIAAPPVSNPPPAAT